MRTESNSFELCRMQPMLNNHYINLVDFNVFYLNGSPFRAIRQNWLLTIIVLFAYIFLVE